MLPGPLRFSAVIATGRPLKTPVAPALDPVSAPEFDRAPDLVTPEKYKRWVRAAVVADMLASAPLVYNLGGFAWEGPVPLRFCHGPALLGQVCRAWVQDGRLWASGIIDRISMSSWHVAETARQGKAWQTSVAVNLADCDFREISEGETAEVNGRPVAGPAVVCARWRLAEVSVTDDAADGDTTFTVEPLTS